MHSFPIPVPSLGPDLLLVTHRSHDSTAQTAQTAAGARVLQNSLLSYKEALGGARQPSLGEEPLQASNHSATQLASGTYAIESCDVQIKYHLELLNLEGRIVTRGQRGWHCVP